MTHPRHVAKGIGFAVALSLLCSAGLLSAGTPSPAAQPAPKT